MAADGSNGRVFLRGVSSQKYALTELRRSTLEAPRVRNSEVVTDDGSVGHYGMSKDTSIWWRVAPGDEPFLTQTLQVHFVRMEPHSANAGHGHQNEAVFYILEGHGHEVHDEQRYEWKQGDLVVVHADSVHQHFNDSDGPAITLVIKAKSLWMYLGLVHQGKPGSFDDKEGRFGPREDWSHIWAEDAVAKQKIITPDDIPWEDNDYGRIRRLTGPGREDVRCNSVDIYQQQIPPGGTSSKHWRMGDEVFYVISGHGESLHWEVDADIEERYHARISREPTRHEIRTGDILWAPQNSVRQHVNLSDDEPLVLLAAQNSVFRHVGYARTHVFEPASAEQHA